MVSSDAWMNQFSLAGAVVLSAPEIFTFAAVLGSSPNQRVRAHRTGSLVGVGGPTTTITASLTPTSLPVDPHVVAKNFAALEDEVRAGLNDQGLSYSNIRLVRELDVRYTMQMFEVSTPVASGLIDQNVVDDIVTAFEQRYASLYGEGTGFREAGVQAITYRVYGIGELPFKPELPVVNTADSPTPPVQNRRRALLDAQSGWQDVAIYNYSTLASGHVFHGPAIVEAPTTTVVIPEYAVASIDKLGNLVLNRRKEQ